ncbi:UNVERIFIED_CONTAM: hypothetical protein GTU68_008566 [Idotea baltica]|nr:hypothetical protein [Idotea baltica]
MAISLIYQFGIHTQMIKKLPWVIELVMNTPSHHRVHHGSNVVYLDKNYGGILIIWDRIFGTFKAEIDSEPVIYGITNNIKTHNLLHIATHEFTDLANDIKRAPNFKTRIKYLFMPPGWHHNKPVKTAEALQKANDKL